MKKLLITGFDPFGGESDNPSRRAVERLPDRIGDFQLIKLQIPTVFSLAAEQVVQCAREHQADAILCVGQAGGRAAVTPELVAINLRHASICDNAGNQPQDEPIAEGAPKAYFSTLPVRKMAQAIEASGTPARVSYSAGTFVCNDVLYTVLHRLPQIPAAFIHVPYLPEQAKQIEPSMPLQQITQALQTAIEAI